MISAFRDLFLFLFLLGTSSVFAQTESKVFVTKTGAKYHRSTLAAMIRQATRTSETTTA
ncbi:hypothetical protein J0A67_17240 [Algoriphagus aestuariicola]|uniref:Uncharacterized protein n=1 Tax=Algoriphagus aestuariicola TaxID=1852016 RepID=A0ABS3BUW4_9BACT|nr:hypothetical protein [Algoriphagus aestuariicola]MBN7802624.1 hypothetical protein [Algoriphagus aestuariicola]